MNIYLYNRNCNFQFFGDSVYLLKPFGIKPTQSVSNSSLKSD
jgi:hypothetical protein